MASEVRLRSLIERIRPEVRAERVYHVDSFPGITVKLNQNESPFDLSDSLKREVLEEAIAVPFNRYPTEQPFALQDAIGRSIGISGDWVLVGNGSNELTHTLGISLIARSSAVALPRPMFALFESVVRLFGGRVVGVPPRQDLSFDAPAILEAVKRENPVLTVLATPNNPTGLEMQHEDVRSLVEAAQGFVLVDEAYAEFAEEPSALGLLDDHPNVLVMRTMSKGFGLAGLRLGYLVARPEVLSEILKARLPFMVDEIAQRAAMRLLANPEIVQERLDRIRRSVQELAAELSATGLEIVPSHANFLLFKTDLPPPELIRSLAARGVLVRDMSGYPELRGFVRVSAGTPAENKAFLTALKAALNRQ